MGNWKYSKKTGTHTFLQIKIKKITHMGRRWDTPQHFFSGIYWWTLKNPKNQNFEKRKKNCWRYHHFTRVTKTTIIWGTVPEIQSKKNFFLSFWVIFDLYLPPLITQKNKTWKKMKKASRDATIVNLYNRKHDQMMHAYLDMECDRHNCLSF